jgi:hypothetical protein
MASRIRDLTLGLLQWVKPAIPHKSAHFPSRKLNRVAPPGNLSTSQQYKPSKLTAAFFSYKLVMTRILNPSFHPNWQPDNVESIKPYARSDTASGPQCNLSFV